jgi:NADP-dependent 3-hydroxy acid dehydrogenase YdfG
VLDARRQDRIQALARELIASGGKAMAVTTDVTDRAHVVKNLVDTAVRECGRVDVMINNAGLMPQAPLKRLKIDEWDRTIDVNLEGVLYGTAAALPYMRQQKSGHFINVSSVAGHKVGPGFAVYAATKFGVRALSEGLRQKVKPYNIRTIVISPGAVATELLDSVPIRMRLHESASSTRNRRSPPPRSHAWSPSPSTSRMTPISMRSCSGPRARNTERNDPTCPTRSSSSNPKDRSSRKNSVSV